jgi:lactoylglutathione lyase
LTITDKYNNHDYNILDYNNLGVVIMKTNVDFISIQVKDLESSSNFYTNILGFEKTEDKRPDATVFKDDKGAIFAIRKPMFEIKENMLMGLGVSIWFGVDDIEKTFTSVKNSDAQIISPLAEGPFGKMFIIKDMDGYMMTFHQL